MKIKEPVTVICFFNKQAIEITVSCKVFDRWVMLKDTPKYIGGNMLDFLNKNTRFLFKSRRFVI